MKMRQHKGITVWIFLAVSLVITERFLFLKKFKNNIKKVKLKERVAKLKIKIKISKFF